MCPDQQVSGSVLHTPCSENDQWSSKPSSKIAATARAGYRLRQVGWMLPEGVDAADEMVLPAHGVDYVTHVQHGDCLPLYIIEEKPDGE